MDFVRIGRHLEAIETALHEVRATATISAAQAHCSAVAARREAKKLVAAFDSLVNELDLAAQEKAG